MCLLAFGYERTVPAQWVVVRQLEIRQFENFAIFQSAELNYYNSTGGEKSKL